MVRASYYEAHNVRRDYVCSACWGELDYRQDNKYNPRDVAVFCSDCKDETPGFVSRKFVERRITESQNQYFIARDALREAIPWMFPHTKIEATPQAILSALGY
jgi:hypothetical protein